MSKASRAKNKKRKAAKQNKPVFPWIPDIDLHCEYRPVGYDDKNIQAFPSANLISHKAKSMHFLEKMSHDEKQILEDRILKLKCLIAKAESDLETLDELRNWATLDIEAIDKHLPEIIQKEEAQQTKRRAKTEEEKLQAKKEKLLAQLAELDKQIEVA